MLTPTPWVPLPDGIELQVGVSEMEITAPLRVMQSKHRFAWKRTNPQSATHAGERGAATGKRYLSGAVQCKVVLSELVLKDFAGIVHDFICS
jgi:hypothetical protein